MAQAAPSLEQLIAQLDSLDATDRFEAIESLKRYAGHRKVTQAVFLLRNDPDRRVRESARALLEEADRRTSESLSVPGHDAQEREEYLKDLLEGLKAQDPTDRVTALKELRMLDDPRAVGAIERMRKDGNRVVRMLAEEAYESRKAKAVPRPTTSEWDGNVMVSSPVSEKPRMNWKERGAGRLGPGLVPWLGLLYVAIGLPFTCVCLWLWLGRRGVFASPSLASFAAYAPLPAHYDLIRLRLGVPGDPVSLALAFVVGAVQTVGGLGLVFRLEGGRKTILLYHAVLFLFGMLLPGIASKVLPGVVSAVIVYYLTRPGIVDTFRGAPGRAAAPTSAQYGEMERKVW